MVLVSAIASRETSDLILFLYPFLHPHQKHLNFCSEFDVAFAISTGQSPHRIEQISPRVKLVINR
jgi:hypothetical protein